MGLHFSILIEHGTLMVDYYSPTFSGQVITSMCHVVVIILLIR